MTTPAPAWSPDESVELLARVAFFQGLTRADLERLATAAGRRALDAGELLFRDGEASDRVYVVRSGAVELLRERPRGDHERLAIARVGEVIGEYSVLADAPRMGIARAIEPTQLLAIGRGDLEMLLGDDSFARRLVRSMAKAVRTLGAQPVSMRSGGTEAADPLRDFSRLVRRGLLPRHVEPVEGFEIAAAVVAEDGGSGQALWQSLSAGGGTLLAVLDTKGSGLPAGYLIGVTTALLRELGRTEADLVRLLPRLNQAVAGVLVEGRDAYVQVGLLRLRPENASYALAGQQPGFVLRATGEVEELTSHGPPLGILPQFDYGASQLELGSGDLLLLCSEIGAELARDVAALVLGRRQEPAARLAATVQTALREVAGGGGAADAAFLVVKRQ